MKSKGIALSLPLVLSGLLVIGMVAFLILFYYERYFDIHTMVKEAGVERHTITLAQVLLSSRQIAYVDDLGVTHRAVLDKEKLDTLFIHDIGSLNSNVLNTIFTKNELFQEMSYPNAFYVVQIEDLEPTEGETRKWITIGRGRMGPIPFNTVEYIGCMASKASSFSYIWEFDIWEFGECIADLESETGLVKKKFPVAIRVSDEEIHVGMMSILSTEL